MLYFVTFANILFILGDIYRFPGLGTDIFGGDHSVLYVVYIHFLWVLPTSYFPLAGSVQRTKKIWHKPLSFTCSGSVVIGSSAASLVLVSSCRVGVQRQGMVMRRGTFRKLNQMSPCIGILPPLLLAPGVSPKIDL